MSAELFYYNTIRETGRLASGSFGLSSYGALTWIDDPLESIIRKLATLIRGILGKDYCIFFLNVWKTAIDQSR